MGDRRRPDAPGRSPLDREEADPEVGCLLAVLGQTASGKSGLAVRLAEKLGGEVINADSRQVYRSMDIGTAKPTAEERSRVRHWLIDIIEPDAPFSLGTYLKLAREAIADCWARGKLPILVGGTGQYVWAVIEGWQVPQVAADVKLRAELQDRADRRGPDVLLEELRRIDPVYAERVDPRNLRRVIRGIEVYRLTGQPMSTSQTRKPLDCRWRAVGINHPRDELYLRIDARVDRMMSAGLLDEVRRLTAQGYACTLRSMSGIGYRQLCQHLAGDLSRDEAVERIKTGTHRLARTQRNWFRLADERIDWIEGGRDTLQAALNIVESKLAMKKDPSA